MLQSRGQVVLGEAGSVADALALTQQLRPLEPVPCAGHAHDRSTLEEKP